MSARVPPLDLATLAQGLEACLALLNVAITIADREHRVRYADAVAERLWRPVYRVRIGEPLPDELRAAVRHYLDEVTAGHAVGLGIRGPDPVRFEPPGVAKAYYLRATPLGDGELTAIVAWEEFVREGKLFEALRDRYGLSAREFQIASLIRYGRSNRQIAHLLGTTEGTVKVLIHRLFTKVGVARRAELVALLDSLGKPPAGRARVG